MRKALQCFRGTTTLIRGMPSTFAGKSTKYNFDVCTTVFKNYTVLLLYSKAANLSRAFWILKDGIHLRECRLFRCSENMER